MSPDAYQQSRQLVLEQLEALRQTIEHLKTGVPVFFNELPVDVTRRFLHLDREVSRLRREELSIAFVGGFSAGKSSIVNAFLGRYLLPESTKVTTAVPTFIRRCGPGGETARLLYLRDGELEDLDLLFRRELAKQLGVPELENSPRGELLDAAKGLTADGPGRDLVERYRRFSELRQGANGAHQRKDRDVSIEEMRGVVVNEDEAVFLNRVEVFVDFEGLPEDVQLVDLPGVGVPNPRHRDLTFRFVESEAHAVVFVLNSTAFPSKDEYSIIERLRAGNQTFSDRAFWVLNRWDSLTVATQQESLTQFTNLMASLNLGADYRYFTTNALHGLLSQLCDGGESISDPKLVNHQADYLRALDGQYGGSHKKALTDSQVPELRREVMSFLNERIRASVIRGAVENAEKNAVAPLLHHLAAQRTADERFVESTLQTEENEEARKRAAARYDQAADELRTLLRRKTEWVAQQKAAIFGGGEAEELENELIREIEEGEATDAYATYLRIIADGTLRKFPYYFEIEMKVVDSLNTLVKQRFREIIRRQTTVVVKTLLREITDALELLNADIGYDAQVSASLESILAGSKESMLEAVDSAIIQKACHLDELLIHKSKGFFGFFGGDNSIVSGLEQVAKNTAAQINDPGEAVTEDMLASKTKHIRAALKGRYIDQTNDFRKKVADDVWPNFIFRLQELRDALLSELGSRYRSLLDKHVAQEVHSEKEGVRNDLLGRSLQFRKAIERVTEIRERMRQPIVGPTVQHNHDASLASV